MCVATNVYCILYNTYFKTKDEERMKEYRVSLVLLLTIGLLMIIATLSTIKESVYSKRCITIVQNSVPVDMLGLFTGEPTLPGEESSFDRWFGEDVVFTEDDYKRIKESGIRLFSHGELFYDYQEMINSVKQWKRLTEEASEYLICIESAEDLDNLQRSDKIGVIISYQNSVHFRSVDDVELFYNLGQRVSQLTYNEQNNIGSGAFCDIDSGLTCFGRSIIGKMNELGMVVDLSHCGTRTTLDAIECSNKPVLFTHAVCEALMPEYPRSKTDEEIIKMAEKGGVIGIPVLRFMIRDKEPVTIEHFLDHIDHVVNLVGVDHVGIGSDQNLESEDAYPVEYRRDRLENAPAKYRCHTSEDYLISIEDLNHRLRTFDIVEGLIRRGYSDEDIEKIIGGNFVRVLKQIL